MSFSCATRQGGRRCQAAIGGLLALLAVACSRPTVQRAHDERPRPAAQARSPVPAPEAPASSPPAMPLEPAPVASARSCRHGERLDSGCDCNPGRACFDICCGPGTGCAHPRHPGGWSACMLLPTPLAPPSGPTGSGPTGSGPTGPRLVFACGDKYASASCDEAAWLPAQAAQVDAGLLQHDQGGPEGAVWNGNAALWLGVPDAARSVSFGGPLTAGPSLGGRRWYRVAPSVWQARLRAVPGKPYRAIALVVDGQAVGAFWYAEGE